jgi:DNA-binding response OmpR family regulator
VPKLGTETILVVDDAEVIRKMVCIVLAQAGYRCLEAADGIAALRLLEGARDGVNLMLTDITMPGMNGAELARRVGDSMPHVRILFMSGHADDPAMRTVARMTALFLAKPFTIQELTEKVRCALDRPWRGVRTGQQSSTAY